MEISLSPSTGGISQVRTYGRGGNRLSQQLAWRFPRERTITTVDEGESRTRKTWYSDMVLREHRILSAGPALGEVETVGDLLDPANGKLLATYRQTVRLYRGRPFAEVEIELGVEKNPEGDPWTNYLAARFAWSDADQMLTRSQQESACPVKDEQRLESPHYLELASEAHRTTILTGGLSFHRSTGPRMLDTILVTEGEAQRRFRFGLAVDHSFPMEAAIDWESPPIVLPVDHGPPRPGPTGWLFQIAARNIQLRRLLPLRGPAAEQSRTGCIIRLQETEGRNKTFRLTPFRPPTKAQQVDLTGRPLHTFKIEGGAVLVSMAPNELCDVEVRWD
jgi:alpha-mannosidase